MNVLFNSDIGDAHCGLRSIKKASYDRLTLTSPGMEFASEFLIEAVRSGARVEQVPITYRLRHGGQPKLRTFRDGIRHLRLMLGSWRAGPAPRGEARVDQYGPSQAAEASQA
jgi:hypothetical protein